MAIRNFYIAAQIDGRKTKLSGGPARKDGGLDIYLYQRNHGGIDTAAHINCFEENGQLFTYIYMDGKVVGAYGTER